VSHQTRSDFQRLLASGALFEEYARMQRELAEIAQEMRYPLAQLRHAYQQMLMAESMIAPNWARFANGLVSPQLAKMEGLIDRLHRLQQGADQ
jgi:hypothetical protein